jgi:hypothetical protein
MGIFPFCFPAVLFLRLQVWRRQRNLAGKSPPPDSDLFDDAEFGKNLAGLSITIAASAIRRFQFEKSSQLFIRTHNVTLAAIGCDYG